MLFQIILLNQVLCRLKCSKAGGQERITWYTTMVGKKATLRTLRQAVHRAGASAVRATEFAQGRTSRWALAWSFTVQGQRQLAASSLQSLGPPLVAPAARIPRLASFAEVSVTLFAYWLYGSVGVPMDASAAAVCPPPPLSRSLV